MKFELNQMLLIIQRTPAILNKLLYDLPDPWVHTNEGADTWSIFDVIGHLIVCEKTDFIPRTNIILSRESKKIIPPLDMYAHFEASKGKTINELLAEFALLRQHNIETIIQLQLQHADLEKKATHPIIGVVSLQDLLATWVVHDLGHLAQISRIMAKQYKTEVGAFSHFLTILHK